MIERFRRSLNEEEIRSGSTSITVWKMHEYQSANGSRNTITIGPTGPSQGALQLHLYITSQEIEKALDVLNSSEVP